MDQGTAEDYALLQRTITTANEDLVGNVLSMLDHLKAKNEGSK